MRFHTSLPVSDIDATIDFYRVLLDVEPTKVKSDYAKFLSGDRLNITFHTKPDAIEPLRAMHLGFELASPAALEQAQKRLEAAGLISAERETSICCYANQDKLWVTDPDGYQWELYYLVEDSDIKIAPATGCCATPEASEASEPVATTSCC